MHKLGLSKYDSSQWRLFIDVIERSLTGVLQNENVFGSVSVAYSVLLKESHENLGTLLFRIKYQEHNWQVRGDFKIFSVFESTILNVRGDSDVRQTEIHTAEPLVPEPSAFKVQITGY